MVCDVKHQVRLPPNNSTSSGVLREIRNSKYIDFELINRLVVVEKFCEEEFGMKCKNTEIDNKVKRNSEFGKLCVVGRLGVK